MAQSKASINVNHYHYYCLHSTLKLIFGNVVSRPKSYTEEVAKPEFESQCLDLTQQPVLSVQHPGSRPAQPLCMTQNRVTTLLLLPPHGPTHLKSL